MSFQKLSQSCRRRRRLRRRRRRRSSLSLVFFCAAGRFFIRGKDKKPRLPLHLIDIHLSAEPGRRVPPRRDEKSGDEGP